MNTFLIKPSQIISNSGSPGTFQDLEFSTIKSFSYDDNDPNGIRIAIYMPNGESYEAGKNMITSVKLDGISFPFSEKNRPSQPGSSYGSTLDSWRTAIDRSQNTNTGTIEVTYVSKTINYVPNIIQVAKCFLNGTTITPLKTSLQISGSPATGMNPNGSPMMWAEYNHRNAGLIESGANTLILPELPKDGNYSWEVWKKVKRNKREHQHSNNRPSTWRSSGYFSPMIRLPAGEALFHTGTVWPKCRYGTALKIALYNNDTGARSYLSANTCITGFAYDAHSGQRTTTLKIR